LGAASIFYRSLRTGGEDMDVVALVACPDFLEPLIVREDEADMDG
jgi:hypothetical protein